MIGQLSKSTGNHNRGQSLWNRIARFMSSESGDRLELQPLRPGTPVPLETRLGLDEPIIPLQIKGEDTVHENYSHHYKYQYTDIQFWKEYVFPSDVPTSVHLWRLENLAIPICYLTVGIMQGMMRPVLNVYPLDLGATEAQQTTLASIATLPASYKILFGFLSDTLPILGFRRKPYMLFGWLLASSSMAALLCTSNLSLADNNLSVDGKSPSMAWLMIVFFLAGCGLWLADVMADSIVAQKTKQEPQHAHGNMQSTCYACRFFGLMVAAPISTRLYSKFHGPELAIWILAITPLVLVLPLIYSLYEERHVHIPPVADQCHEIWNTVSSRAVWQPMAFIYMFNLLQVPNAAWRQYLSTVLGFTAHQLNTLLVLSYVLLFAGTFTYKIFFLHSSWRRVYLACIFVNGIASSLQLALIQGRTAGISPFWFAFGDDALADFVVGIQFLPVAILMVTLCPTGSEGASYAMFTTVWNSAMLLSPAISSSLLLGIWDVDKKTMASGDLSGLFKLTILTTVIQIIPISFLKLLPEGREELEVLNRNYKSRVGGAIFVCLVFLSLIYTFAVSLLNIIRPGWAGET